MVKDGLTPQASDMWNVEPEIKQKVNREAEIETVRKYYELGKVLKTKEDISPKHKQLWKKQEYKIL